MTIEWRPITGFEGMYEMGTRSIAETVWHPKHGNLYEWTLYLAWLARQRQGKG